MNATKRQLEYELVVHNERIDTYFRKYDRYHEATGEVARLMIPLLPRQEHVMDRIDELLDGLDTCFMDLGHTDEGGRFDLHSYQCMRIVRGIVDGEIGALDQVPEALRAEFADAFEHDAKEDGRHLIRLEFHRRTELIQKQVASYLEELQRYVGPVSAPHVREGFEHYLDELEEVPKNLALLMKNLNNVWCDYKEAAIAVARHFNRPPA